MNRGPGLGRIYKLNSKYPNVKFEVSTINQKPLKSLTLETRFWYQKIEGQDPKKQLDTLFRNCKRTLFNNSDGFYDEDKLISIQDIPLDLTTTTKKIFSLFEFTLFISTEDKSDMNITMESNRIVDKLFKDVFVGQENIYCSKG